MKNILTFIALIIVFYKLMTASVLASSLVNIFGFIPQSSLTKHNVYSSINNPINILNMQEKWRLNLLSFDITLDKQFLDLYNAIKTSNNPLLKDIQNNIAKSYHNQFGTQVLSLALRGSSFAFGFYPLALSSFESSFHRGFSSRGIFNNKSLVAVGGLLNVAYSFGDQVAFIKHMAFLDSIDLGLNLKFLRIYGFEKRLTMADILNNRKRFGKFFEENLEKDDFTSFDLGTSIKLYDGLSVDFSVLNLISLGKKAKALVPRSFNAKTSYTVQRKESLLSAYKLSLGFEDISFTYEDKDIFKRMNAQAEAQLFNYKWFSVSPMLGIYQKAVSTGLGLDLNWFNLNYSTYVKTPRFATKGSRQHHLFINISF